MAALASDQNGAARGDTRGSLLESAILLAANAAPSAEERVKAYRSELVMRECGEFSEAEIAEALRTDKENAKRER